MAVVDDHPVARHGVAHIFDRCDRITIVSSTDSPFVAPRDVARVAISGKVRTYYAADLLLVVEVISPRSGSEQVDRVRKVGEYARSGIPVYWIVDLEPEVKITILTLHGGEYVLDADIRAGHALTTSQPFAINFDPGSVAELE